MAISGNHRSLGLLFALAPLSVGCTPVPTISFDPPSWDFGTVAYGDEASKTITVTNTSGYIIQVESQSTSDGQQVRVEGLPILNLKPGDSAPLIFTFRPALFLRGQQGSAVTSGFDLDIGGYSGGTWGDLSAQVSYDVTGEIASFDGGGGPVCDPGPDGDTTSFGGVPPDAFTSWSQQAYACVSIAAPDGGTSCQSPADCPTHCCACPSDCAGFTAQACVLGTCAPAAVVCSLVQSQAAHGPALCPDGGNAPSSVLGPLGFTVGGSGERSDSGTITVALSRVAIQVWEHWTQPEATSSSRR